MMIYTPGGHPKLYDEARREAAAQMLRVAREFMKRELERERAILESIGPGGSSNWHSRAVLSPPRTVL